MVRLCGKPSTATPRKEDINNEDIKNLAMRLKGRSDSETLNNVLEWQEKNITYWVERAWIIIILPVSIFSLVGVVDVLCYYI
ncbi:MAG: transglutaminase-like domain-containing protein [Archaeoglobaceae archaeon]